jgi:acyl-CoA thioester hydrolase
MHEMRTPQTSLNVQHVVSVRYGETDQMGVVYHVNYLIWFHEARDALLRERGLDLVKLERSAYRFPVVDVGCQYLSSARYGDDVVVTASLKRELVARMRFIFQVHHQRTKRLLATGHSVSVITDHQGRLLIRTPPEISSTLFGDSSEICLPNHLDKGVHA